MAALLLVPVFCLIVWWRYMCHELEALRADQASGAVARSDWRRAVLEAFVIVGLLITAQVHLLSPLGLIGFGPILAWWLASLALAIALCLRTRGALRRASAVAVGGEAEWRRGPLGWFQWVLLGGCGVLALLCLVVALWSPPNTWDSMAYHMPRIEHWLQNGNVGFIPTPTLRENHQNPWAEYAVMQFQALARGDRFANFTDWAAWLGMVIGASLLARQLGGGVRAQVFAAVFAATLPMGVMQASSTETDTVQALWMVCFAHFLLRMILGGERERSWRGFAWLGLGAALGFAIMTKATGYILGFPFMLWLVASLAWRARGGGSQARGSQARGLRAVGRAAALVGAIGLVIIAINLPHYVRNFQGYGHPLGPRVEPGDMYYVNDAMSPALFVSNVVRNLGLHWNTPSPTVNAWILDRVQALHDAMGVPLNHEETTWKGCQFRMLGYTYNDEMDGDPLQFALLVVALLLAAVLPRFWRDGALMRYVGCMLAGFVLFCLILRWQDWHARIHMAMAALWAPVVGVVLSRVFNFRVNNVLALGMIVAALPWALWNQQRPLLRRETTPTPLPDGTRRTLWNAPRSDWAFEGTAADEPQSAHAIARIRERGYQRLGLVFANFEFEYPLWAWLKAGNPRPPRIQHFGMQNASTPLLERAPFKDFIPDAVLVIQATNYGERIQIAGRWYKRDWSEATAAIYIPEN